VLKRFTGFGTHLDAASRVRKLVLLTCYGSQRPTKASGCSAEEIRISVKLSVVWQRNIARH